MLMPYEVKCVGASLHVFNEEYELLCMISLHPSTDRGKILKSICGGFEGALREDGCFMYKRVEHEYYRHSGYKGASMEDYYRRLSILMSVATKKVNSRYDSLISVINDQKEIILAQQRTINRLTSKDV